MLELRIRISPENAEKVIRLIRELVEVEGAVTVETGRVELQTARDHPTIHLSPPPRVDGLPKGNLVLKTTGKYVGSWGQFNSFFPIKAVLRVLAHMMKENGQNPVNLQALVDRSVQAFRAARLRRYRGFPKKYRKASSVGRLVWHFMSTAHELGLISVEGNMEIPARDWDQTHVSITREGWEFANLENRLLDWNEREQVLTSAEAEWLTDYLKKLDDEGYKEYSFLKEIIEELEQGNINIATWLEKNERFREYVKSWSRKSEDTARFQQQMTNVATMFAQSKIALLRELGVVRNRRNDYTVIGGLKR